LRLLQAERNTLARFLPALDEALAAVPLREMEQANNPAIGIFRSHGGTGLLIPTKYGGLGATPFEAARLQRAIGSRAPSLAIATTMHHFSVVSIVELMETDKASSNFAWMLLEAIARQRLYVASGFAEGQTGASILTANMRARRTDAGLIVNGSKKPCSLSASMDILTASVSIESSSGNTDERAVVVVPANTPGIERRQFWASPILAGAESDEIILRDALVSEKLIAHLGAAGSLSAMESRAFLWFELLIASSYLGIATGLVERVISSGKGSPTERALLGIEVEGAMAALERVSQMMVETIESSDDQLVHALFVRFAVQRAIERATTLAAELCGGIGFATSFDVGYLYAASRALAFHPPSRLSVASALDHYITGTPFQVL
jgi:alkylation response protein AidB-like acyl-CoA dehydrogenase